MAVRARIVVL